MGKRKVITGGMPIVDNHGTKSKRKVGFDRGYWGRRRKEFGADQLESRWISWPSHTVGKGETGVCAEFPFD